MTYVEYARDGSIKAVADFMFPGSEQVDFEVVRGYDGRLYKAGEEPVKSAEEIAAEQAEQRRAEILAELDRIDRASARSARAILAAQAEGKEPVNADMQMLLTYEAEAQALREELREFGTDAA